MAAQSNKVGRAGLILLLGGLLIGCREAPLTGRNQLLLLPKSAEIAMGVQAYQEMLQMEPVAQAPLINDQLTQVGRRIAAVTGEDDYDWEFTVFAADETANAFCLPGGKIGLYTGMIPIAQSDAGLAVVLGHEIAHATARHGGERISENLILQLGLAAVQLALQNRDPEITRLVMAALGLGVQVGVVLPFSRLQESEADYIGLMYMAQAGFDPRQAPAFWQRMAAAAGGARPPEFLSTHPSPETRIADLMEWMPTALAIYEGRPPPDAPTARDRGQF